MAGEIVILVMAEEKWQEADFMRREIETRGYRTVIADIGLMGKPQGECDITREEIIAASGYTWDEVDKVTDRGKRMPIMVKGAVAKVTQLYSDGDIDGIVSIGGSTGTQMGTAIMKALPFGVSKLAVSSTASLPGFASRYIGTADIVLMHTVVEIAGLNDLMRNVLSRAAGAICGMVEGSVKAPASFLDKGEKQLVAMTHFGPCEECAVIVRKQLEKRGYQVIGFSAAGVGDRAMEDILERQDIFTAVIDLAPGGVGEELLGFTRAAGPRRLEGAGRRGIPQIIAPCAVNWGSPLKKEYKPEYEHRKKYDYDASRTFIRLSKDEMIAVANTMADKLNNSRGPVKFLIPLGGWSSLDKRGREFYDKELDKVFASTLKKRLKKTIEIREIDADLETPEFANAIIKAFDELIPPRPLSGSSLMRN